MSSQELCCPAPKKKFSRSISGWFSLSGHKNHPASEDFLLPKIEEKFHFATFLRSRITERKYEKRFDTSHTLSDVHVSPIIFDN
jgi:hypothetical protein